MIFLAGFSILVSEFIFFTMLNEVQIGEPSMTEDEQLELDYECPQCGQPCSKEEYENGCCLDWDQIHMSLFEES